MKDQLQQFIDMGGEVILGKQRNSNQDKYLMSIKIEIEGETYRKGAYFKDQEQALLYLQPGGDFLTQALAGVDRKIAEVADEKAKTKQG